MCGIAGYIGRKYIADDLAKACLKSMEHRGPDGSGLYRHEHSGMHVLMLHTRLSILDLDERASQPMHYENLHVVFNGELYNYVELREDLIRRGESFMTTGDTEVLLHSLYRDETEALAHMEGMWAFACYDAQNGVMTLCRDRFGEKPLFYHETSHGVYFASEIRSLMILAATKFSPERRHLKRFLVNGYKALHQHPSGFFKEVAEVPQASYMVLDGRSQPSFTRYWNPQYTIDSHMTFEDAVTGARERLLSSMDIRLRSDVPLAFCLSGGVDSSALVSIARNIFQADVHGFTIVNDDKRYDEWDIVENTIEQLQLKHSCIHLMTDDFIPNMRKMVSKRAAPVTTISSYVQWLLFKAVAENGYKVSFGGTAADELFTGYYDHYLMHLAEVSGAETYDTAKTAWLRHIKPVVRNPFLQDYDAFIKNPSQRDHIFLNRETYSEMLHDGYDEPFEEEFFRDGLLRNRMLNELHREVVPVLLREEDSNAMYYSVENRSPFLDSALYELCHSIPTQHLIADGFNKVVLREAMRGIVPDMVLDNRRKVGFNAPLFDLLDIENPDIRDALLSESPIFEYVKKDRVERLLQLDKLPNSDSKFLFSFIGCKLFLEEYQ